MRKKDARIGGQTRILNNTRYSIIVTSDQSVDMNITSQVLPLKVKQFLYNYQQFTINNSLPQKNGYGSEKPR